MDGVAPIRDLLTRYEEVSAMWGDPDADFDKVGALQAELEAKIKIAEEKSQKANVIIKNRVITKTKIVREKQIVVEEKIREVEKKINERCELDPAVIEIHNQAAGTPGDAK